MACKIALGFYAPELTEWLQLVWALAEEDQTTRERKLEEANAFLQENR